VLIDTNITIAYKCYFCGTYEFFNISVFELPDKRELKLKCRCGKCSAVILKDSPKKYALRVGCIACGREHTYNVSRREMVSKSIEVFNCPITGIQQCFVGNDHEVRKKVDGVEEELDELVDMLGYESYFKNTQVAFDSLNKIHDIAEKGNLYCTCGNRDIELFLFTEKILLKCSICGRSIEIGTGSNEDLKKLLSSNQILLGCEESKA
jgi:hypothetical protein